MLHWLPSERNKYIFLAELIIVSTLAHLFLGVLLFVVYKGGVSSFRIELGKSHSPTLFVPLKRPSMFNHASCQTQGSSLYRRKGVGEQSSKKHESTNNVSQNASKRHRMFGSDTTMKLDSGNYDQKIGNKQKKVAAKKTKNCDKKEIKSKKRLKGNDKKHIAPNIEPAKKIQEEKIQPIVVPEHQEQKQAIPPNNPVQQSEPTPIEAQPLATDPVTTKQIANTQESPVVDGHISEQEVPDELPIEEIVIGQVGDASEYVTAEQARIYECIEQEIVSRWRPPCGLSKELSCQIKCCIGGSGEVVLCTIEKPSGALIYDMAARSAARAMSLPRWSWGKEFTIVFKQ